MQFFVSTLPVLLFRLCVCVRACVRACVCARARARVCVCGCVWLYSLVVICQKPWSYIHNTICTWDHRPTLFRSVVTLTKQIYLLQNSSFDFVCRRNRHKVIAVPSTSLSPLTARVVGAPQVTSQPVSSKFLCSPLLSGTWRTPGLSIS